MLGYGSSQHTLMATCFSRVILMVSYIGPYLSWVSPRVLHLWPNYPPTIINQIQARLREAKAKAKWKRNERDNIVRAEVTQVSPAAS